MRYTCICEYNRKEFSQIVRAILLILIALGIVLLWFIPEIVNINMYNLPCTASFPEYKQNNQTLRCMKVEYQTFTNESNHLFTQCSQGQLMFDKDETPNTEEFILYNERIMLQQKALFEDEFTCFIHPVYPQTHFEICYRCGHQNICYNSFNLNFEHDSSLIIFGFIVLIIIFGISLCYGYVLWTGQVD